MAEKICGVYKITAPSGKCYVGSSVHVMSRWSGHRSQLRSGRHHCQPLQRAAKKYGVDSLVFELIGTCERDHVRQLEQLAINCLLPDYNSTENTREPLSDLWRDPGFRARGVKRSGENIARLRQDPAFLARQKAAASKVLKARMADPDYMASHTAAYSIPNINRVNADPALKAKAADGRRKRYAEDPDAAARRSDCGRASMAALHADPAFRDELKVRGLKHMTAMRADPEARAKNRAGVIAAHGLQVVCLSTGRVFESIASASEWCGKSRKNTNTIKKAAWTGREAYGHRWALVDKGAAHG